MKIVLLKSPLPSQWLTMCIHKPVLKTPLNIGSSTTVDTENRAKRLQPAPISVSVSGPVSVSMDLQTAR